MPRAPVLDCSLVSTSGSSPLCVWCSGVLHVAAFGSAVLLDYRYAVLSSLLVGSHLGFEYPGVWVHVDMAYPVYSVSCRHWRASVPRALCSAVVTGVCMYVYIYMYVCVCVCVCVCTSTLVRTRTTFCIILIVT